MIVWPGLRRSVSAIQRLFNSASVSLPLTHTAVPTRGSITPTFTRATTETGQRWDEAGYLDFTALAGEMVFKGARRVRNLLTFTEDFSNAAWTKGAVTVGDAIANPVDGSVTALKVKEDNTNSDHRIFQSISVFVSGNVYVYSFYAQAAERRYINLFSASGCAMNATFDLTLGAVTAAAVGIATIEAVGGGWYRCSIKNTATATAGSNMQFRLQSDAVTTSYTGTTGSGIYAWGAQLEDVTGQTTQTASEYVSVGVESAPAYHGSMVDGVKCYDTDRSGNPISTSGSYPLVGYVPWEARMNRCLQSNAFTTAPWTAYITPTPTQNAIGPDGATSAWTLTDNDPTQTELIYQSITLTAAAYTFSVFVKKTTGAQASYPVVDFRTGTVYARATIDTTNGLATAWSAITGGTILVGCSARCMSFNADWWRVELTATGTAAAYTFQLVVAGTTNPTQSTGAMDVAAQGSAVFYGAQVELGSFATPYQPTTTVAVARNADVESVTTSGAILAAGGTISLTYIPYHAPSGTIALWGTYVDASNYTAILHDATNLIFRKRIAGVNYDATIANAFTSGTTYKMAASWGSVGSTICLNGVAGTPHANTTAAQIAATMQFGADGNSLQQPGAAVIKNYIWQRQLSGSEQAAVTA